jgi:8-oxo-dGTP diphosphatase
MTVNKDKGFPYPCFYKDKMANNPQVILKGRYQVVPRTLILVFHGEKVLLQKGSPTKKIWAGYYNGLGGHVEKGEDALSAARRELMEEAGLECPDLYLCGTVMIDVEEQNGILLFVMTGTEINGKINDSEEGSLHWIGTNEFSQLNIVEDIPEMVTRILDTMEKHEIFHAHYGYDEKGKRVTTLG